jgi:hypothetical protein
MKKHRRVHKNTYLIHYRRCPKVEGCKILTKHVRATTGSAARNKTKGIVISVKKLRG